MESLQALFADLPDVATTGTTGLALPNDLQWCHDARPNSFSSLLSYEVRPGEPSLLAQKWALYGEAVVPALFPRCTLVFRNDDCFLHWLGFESPALSTDDDVLDAFGHFRGHRGPLGGPHSPHFLALAYHGTQFGVYNRHLGDGRAFLLGHTRCDRQINLCGPRVGELLDISAKGSGKTPFSRGHDGRLTLGGALRELCFAELLYTLSCPTCRVLTVIATGEWVHRDRLMSPGCVLTRVSSSVLRIGILPSQHHSAQEYRLAPYHSTPRDPAPFNGISRAYSFSQERSNDFRALKRGEGISNSYWISLSMSTTMSSRVNMT
jgi:hypothetical protein